MVLITVPIMENMRRNRSVIQNQNRIRKLHDMSAYDMGHDKR